MKPNERLMDYCVRSRFLYSLMIPQVRMVAAPNYHGMDRASFLFSKDLSALTLDTQSRSKLGFPDYPTAMPPASRTARQNKTHIKASQVQVSPVLVEI